MKFWLDRQITLAGEYEVAGTPALYERDRDREKIRIPGPIKEDIAVYVIYYLNKYIRGAQFPWLKFFYVYYTSNSRFDDLKIISVYRLPLLPITKNIIILVNL